MNLTKTDRIIVTLGRQIVGASTFPDRHCRLKRNCVKSLKPHAILFAKCFAL
jgi:hypothetical protein